MLFSVPWFVIIILPLLTLEGLIAALSLLLTAFGLGSATEGNHNHKITALSWENKRSFLIKLFSWGQPYNRQRFFNIIYYYNSIFKHIMSIPIHYNESSAGYSVAVHSPVVLCFPVCPVWLMRGFQWLCRGLAILNAQDFSFRGNSHLSERSEFGNFPWFLEKFCTFRSAYPRNLNWKPRISQPGQTGKRRPTGLWTVTIPSSRKALFIHLSPCRYFIIVP